MACVWHPRGGAVKIGEKTGMTTMYIGCQIAQLCSNVQYQLFLDRINRMIRISAMSQKENRKILCCFW